ncbi:hypothetical protein E6C50_02030 [Flavobacterium supellecticarium]|uniref:Uncharacterized protein n=1 Tax=Flavobacterium supellecticarium TaxID=2565924 RepID=A0A4S4A3J3_9FLAO|nr:hypothetical protein [Flavobacterium supellecticarium]THF53009.1 hypothetical protein E6C50_02030 [Flavobacterium supellecticarium]
MANSLYGETRLNESLEMARRSKSIAPDIKHWCSHIKIVSEYGGLIGQMGLPTMNHVSCPQADGGSAMNLEWVAHDFIIANCQDCQFHTETFPKNFGRRTLEEYKKYVDKLNQDREEEQKIIENVRTKIKGKISNRFKFSKTTEISILKLVDKLSDNQNQLKIAQSIKESSRLKPAFFNSLSLDYLVLFFDMEDISHDIADSVVNVILADPTKLSDFTKSRILDSFAKGQNLNTIVRLAQYLNLKQEEELAFVTLLINNYFKENFTRQDDPFENFSPFIIKYFQDYSSRQQENFKTVVCNSLKDEDAGIRKNTCLILYQLYILDKTIAIPFLENMILTYNIVEEEDSRGGSDWTVSRTLIRFCYTDIDLVLNTISSKFNTLSTGAKVQILKFYDNFLETDDLRESFPVQSSVLIDKIIGFAASNEIKDDFENPFSILRNLTGSYPTKFSDKFKVFLGFLIAALKEKNTFNWNKNNLNSITTTFNPLIGLNVYDIMDLETKISTKLNNVKDILVNLVPVDETSNFAEIITIIRNLDSKKTEDVDVKIYLISVIRSSIKSNISLVQILPDTYNWLLDINALPVRMEALKLLAVLLKNHFAIIPQTIFDLLLLLIKDDDIVIRKFAIDAYGQILVKKPSSIPKEVTDYLLDQYDSRYVGISHSMSNLTYPLLNMLPVEEHKKLYRKVIMMLANHYSQKDKNNEFCQKILKQAIFLNRKVNSENFIPYEKNIVANYLLPDCSDLDFYKAENSIRLLNDLRRNNDDLNDLWLASALTFIYKYPPRRHEMVISNSFRKKFYSEMYYLKRSDIAKESEAIMEYLKNHLEEIDLYDYDVINVLNIFGYFCLHSAVLNLCNCIIENVQKVPSKDYLFRIINDHKFLSELALAGKDHF